MANSERGLTKEQLELLHELLEKERRRIRAVLRAPTVAIATDDEPNEFEEEAQRATQQSDQLNVGERERALLGEVERALEKLHTGTYGTDEATGEPIPYERLAVVPWARGRAG